MVATPIPKNIPIEELPPAIFDHHIFWKRYNSAQPIVKKIQFLLENTLTERLVFFNKPFTKKILHTFSGLEFENNTIKSDFEYLPCIKNYFNLALSAGPLMLTNDIPGILKQWYASLKTGGIFIATFLGNNTLKELKHCLYEAEQQLNAPHHIRFLPMIHAKDAGMLMQRAGFANPTADVTHHTFYVKNLEELFLILRSMGGNCIYQRSLHPLSRPSLKAIAKLYENTYATSSGLPVTLDIVAITGWAIPLTVEHQIQQQQPKYIGFS